jgi:hypothetical protein
MDLTEVRELDPKFHVCSFTDATHVDFIVIKKRKMWQTCARGEVAVVVPSLDYKTESQPNNFDL